MNIKSIELIKRSLYLNMNSLLEGVVHRGHNWMRKTIALFWNAVASTNMVALLDQGLVSATNFGTGVIIGRACSKEEFGLYTLGFSIVLFLISLQSSLLTTPYMIYTPRLKEKAHAQYAGSTLVHQFALSALAVIAMAISGMLVSAGVGPGDLSSVFWPLAGTISFIMLRDYARRVCFAHLQPMTALALDSLVLLIQIGGLLLLVYLDVITVSGTYWIIGIACFFAVVFWITFRRKTFEIKIGKAFSDFRRNWLLGKWVLATALVWAATINIYPWLITAFHGTAATGIWAACFGTIAIANPILSGIQNIMGPKIVYCYTDFGGGGLCRFLPKAATVSLIAICPLFVTLLFFGGFLVNIFYGGQYGGNHLVVLVLAFTIPCSALEFILSRAFFALGRPDLDFWTSLTSLFILISAGLWLVRSLGPLGAAYAMVLTNLASSILKYLALFRFGRLLARETH